MRTLAAFLVTATWLAFPVVLVAQQPAGSTAPMPIDLPFARKTLARENLFALTADGKKVAYVVQTPPEKSPPQSRLLPNGVPSYVSGNRVLVTDLGTGSARTVAAEGGNCWRPRWSPDDALLAMYCDAGGMPQLWVYDVKQDRSRRVSEAKVKAKLWVGDEPVWSPDARIVYVPLAPGASEPAAPPSRASAPGTTSVTVYRAGQEAPATGAKVETDETAPHFMAENNAAIGAIDVATGAHRTLVPADATPPPSVLQLSPSGRFIAYLSVFHKPRTLDTVSFQDLAVVPAEGGAPRLVADDIRMTAGNYYLGAYIWHPTRDQLFWVKDKQLWTAEPGSGTGEPRRLAAGLGEFTHAPLAVTRDGSTLVAGVQPTDLHDYRDPYPQALALVPLDGQAPRALALPGGMLLQAAVQQAGSALWQPQPQAITLVLRESATAQDAVLRLDLASGRPTTLWKGLARLRLGGAPKDHAFLLAGYEDVNTPGNLYAFDGGFANKRRVSEVEPRLGGLRFGSAETFESLAPRHDGSLAGVTTAVLLPPLAKRGDRLPAVVFLYPGGKVTRSAAEFGGGMPATVPASVFTTRGYAVLLAEIPIGPDGVAGNPREEMVEVLLPQVYRAAGLGYVDVKRVAVSGQSYGGYGTASVASGTNLFRAAVAISGLYDLPALHSWMEKSGRPSMARWAETGQGRMGAPPWSDLRRYLVNSPYYQADRIHTPLLMLHGESDHTCPVEDARKMYAALKRLDRTVQLATYEDEGHVVYEWSLANAVDATNRFLEFLGRYLGDGEARSN